MYPVINALQPTAKYFKTLFKLINQMESVIHLNVRPIAFYFYGSKSDVIPHCAFSVFRTCGKNTSSVQNHTSNITVNKFNSVVTSLNLNRPLSQNDSSKTAIYSGFEYFKLS